MEIVLAVLCGFILDWLLGDPDWMPHPVVYMGKAIRALESVLRKIFPQSNRWQLFSGALLAILLLSLSFVLSTCALFLCRLVHPLLAFGLQSIWCWQCLAVKGLAVASARVYDALDRQDLPAARQAVSQIVGRDTQQLNAEAVCKASIETVAENFCDGVMAPLCYLLIGGAPLGLLYKAINTMDSMLGYKNARYLYFGRFAARLDDVANYLPARLAALLLIAAAGLSGQNAAHAYRIWRRDKRKHASPNSAQTEAAMAGALGVQLGGDAYYFGKLYKKSTIGDADRAVEAADILLANRMMKVASVAGLILCAGIRSICWIAV